MAPKALVDMWPVRCARCRESIGATNGNACIEAAIYCPRCEPKFISEADEMMASLVGLSQSEMKAQASRCGCKGTDEYCVCQNVPDRVTLDGRNADG